MSSNFTIEYKNIQYSFDDLCEREYIGSLNCTSMISGFFNLFDFNPEMWKNQTILNQQLIKHESILTVCTKTPPLVFILCFFLLFCLVGVPL